MMQGMCPLHEAEETGDALTAACRSERFRPYLQTHRQLRAALGRALVNGAQLSPAELDALLTLYIAHQDAEERYLHAPLRARAPRATLAFDAEHEDQLAAIRVLRALLAERSTASSPAEAVTRELELRLAQFIADGLAHMAEEEIAVTRELWRHFTDAQLRELAQAMQTEVTQAVEACRHTIHFS
jgi:hypothetical protein